MNEADLELWSFAATVNVTESRLDCLTRRINDKADVIPLDIPGSRRTAVRLHAYLGDILSKAPDQDSYAKLTRRSGTTFDTPGFIYLMRNNRNGYTKIGFSMHPTHREKTLQSEDPDITMIFTAPGTIYTERGIHGTYSASRIRGEWFNLTAGDCDDIKARLTATSSSD